jgi:hypothetical protein
MRASRLAASTGSLPLRSHWTPAWRVYPMSSARVDAEPAQSMAMSSALACMALWNAASSSRMRIWLFIVIK